MYYTSFALGIISLNFLKLLEFKSILDLKCFIFIECVDHIESCRKGQLVWCFQALSSKANMHRKMSSFAKHVELSLHTTNKHSIERKMDESFAAIHQAHHPVYLAVYFSSCKGFPNVFRLDKSYSHNRCAPFLVLFSTHLSAFLLLSFKAEKERET